MAEVKADVKIGDLLGMKVADGVYLMSDGKMYSDLDGKVEPVEGTVEISDGALANAEDLQFSQKLHSKEPAND